MKTNHATIESFNDLVFENRNKEYGAYVIRNSYNNNVSMALFIALLLSGTLALITFLFSKKNDNIPITQGQVLIPDVSILVDITPPQSKPEIKIEKITPPKDITPKSENLTLVASDNKNDVIETTNKDAVITNKGKPDGTDSIIAKQDIIVTPTITPPANEAKIVADQMPEFNGNLFQFLRDNLKYPDIARENYTSGTVVLQFIVEKDGAIDEIKVLKGIADGCTEEAIRVVKSMPKWKPGKNHGEPVRVLFNLPVKFTIK